MPNTKFKACAMLGLVFGAGVALACPPPMPGTVALGFGILMFGTFLMAGMLFEYLT